MINSKYFFKGLGCVKSLDSPAIALGCCMAAIGALFKNIGLNLQESLFSTFLTYALPGSLVMAETMILGGSLLNMFFAVWLVNSRLYPMTVSVMPLMMHKSQPKWKYYVSCHFVAVSAWLIMKKNYKSIARENRIDRIIIESKTPKLGVITTGKSYLDVRQALEDLGIDEAKADELGLRLYKVGMPWPLEPAGIKEFSEGLKEILVCLLYTSPSPRDYAASRMPSSA